MHTGVSVDIMLETYSCSSDHTDELYFQFSCGDLISFIVCVHRASYPRVGFDYERRAGEALFTIHTSTTNERDENIPSGRAWIKPRYTIWS